jgi:PAS domain S-box-containing protein
LTDVPQPRRGSFEKVAAAAAVANDAPTVTVDANGTILKFNPAAESSFDWCNNDVVGKKITEAAWSKQQPSMTVDENGIILNVNQAAIDHHDWCHSSLVGQHVSSIGDTDAEVLQAPTTAADAPDTRPAMADQHQRSSSSRTSGRWPSFRKQKSQQPVQTLHIIIQPTLLHQGETINIDKRQEQEDTLTQTSDAQQRESILLAIFEASLDPLFQINEHGTIQMVNKAATTVFGWTTEEFLHSDISMICGGPHAPHHHQYMQRYLSTGDTRVMNTRRELPARKKDGTEFPIELALVEVDTYLGEERLFCGFVRDLSNVKEEVRAQLRGH